MHKNRNNQAGLQHHEKQNQEPTHVALNLIVVHGVGHGTQDKQENPNLEIDPQWMLYRFFLSDNGLVPMSCLIHN